MRRVELFELIRKDYDFGLSKREISRKRGIHRRMVRQALASAIPPGRRPPQRISPKLTDEVKAFIDQIIKDDRKQPPKQRHSARRMWQRVTQERGADVAETTVRAYVRDRRRELGVGIKAYVPQHHDIGAQAEADFYEAEVDFPWGRQTAHILALRSEFSGASLHTAYPQQSQAAFLEALEESLLFLGGVFAVVRFDNLSQAVLKVLKGKRRTEQDRFIAFRSHYLFDSSFTSPGRDGAHEKGGIEGEVGRFRRRWLTPVPTVSSWGELNSYLRTCCLEDLSRTITGHDTTVGHAADKEREFLKPLPKERFEVSEIAETRVDQKSRVQVKTNRYSVPVSLVGRKVSVRVTPMKVIFSYAGTTVACHDRVHLKGVEELVLDHYLELLSAKPGAFAGSVPLHQARQRGDFPPSYELLWERLKTRCGEQAGTRELIEVLLLHRSYGKEAVATAVGQALRLGAIDPKAIAMLARDLTFGHTQLPADLDVGELARFERPPPQLGAYNTLLEACR
ncbi:MAG: IS21 family transposase [Actinomycetota bacterium]|nr:IS21 family transposase [Actinomycetota bacterium]